MNSTTKTDAVTQTRYPDELQPGTPLLQGQYVIEEFLMSGGFGMTYLARDSLNRIVVIKECFPASFCSRTNNIVRARSRTHQNSFNSIVRLFVREARQLAKLDHPNIVGVHQVFEDNETAYMALDYIDGQDMLDFVDAGKSKFSPPQTRSILMRVLAAVAYVHDKGILHRDISPDNILLESSGNPILIDFGAAREKAKKASRVLSALMVVKDGYSPQEFYVAGGEQGPASDLYSLGASFYHFIVGKAPPDSQIRLAAVAAKKDDPYVPLTGKINGYDQEFLLAIDKALSIFPKDRHQSAREWMAKIDVEKRVALALEVAKRDQNIDFEISKLVQETNREVMHAEKADAEKAMRELAQVNKTKGSVANTQPNSANPETDECAQENVGFLRWPRRQLSVLRFWAPKKSRTEKFERAGS